MTLHRASWLTEQERLDGLKKIEEVLSTVNEKYPFRFELRGSEAQVININTTAIWESDQELIARTKSRLMKENPWEFVQKDFPNRDDYELEIRNSVITAIEGLGGAGISGLTLEQVDNRYDGIVDALEYMREEEGLRVAMFVGNGYSIFPIELLNKNTLEKVVLVDVFDIFELRSALEDLIMEFEKIGMKIPGEIEVILEHANQIIEKIHLGKVKWVIRKVGVDSTSWPEEMEESGEWKASFAISLASVELSEAVIEDLKTVMTEGSTFYAA